MLSQAIKEIMERNEMLDSSSKGIINLIPKKGRDSRLLKNLRPITLLNTDYKIIEKMIAQRMVPEMEYLIHHDQKGFLPGRKIVCNIRKAFEVLKAAGNSNSVYITCDFQKAFDTISTEAIWRTMELYGFSAYLIKWTKLLYANFKAKVQNNGNFSREFKMEQSVHQGAPNSCYYFVLVVELLAEAIRQNTDIQGFKSQEIDALLSQFADDLDTAMENSEKSISTFFKILEWFKYQTGLQLNYDKTTIYRIGSSVNSTAMCYTTNQLKWSSGTMSILGVEVNIDDDIAIETNYKPVMEKAESILGCWQNRGLSLEGKVLVINTLVIPLFIYKMSVLPQMPVCIITRMEKMFENFLWGKKARPKIPTQVLQKSIPNGGMKLVNLAIKDAAQKISWVKIIQEDHEMARAAYNHLHLKLKEKIWLVNLAENDVDKVISVRNQNRFWIDVLKAWCKFNFKSTLEWWHPIWLNSMIRIGDRPIMFEKCFENGLVEVGQLFRENVFISASEAKAKFQMSIMEYNSLQSAILANIKLHGISGKEPLLYEVLERSDTVKVAYSELLEKCASQDPVRQKWEKDTGKLISEEEMRMHFCNVKRITSIAKLRSFQFRMLRRAISTNIQLRYWGIKESDSCSFCSLARETIRHLFVECCYVKNLWAEVIKFIKREFDHDIVMPNFEQVIFNQLCTSKTLQVVNFICLVIKQYIYKQRCLKKSLNMHELIRYIFSFKNAEKFYAIKNNMFSKYAAKWDPETVICRPRYGPTVTEDAQI